MKLVSWNVNGIRSTEQPLLKFLNDEDPDVLMIQEMRAFPDQLSFFLKMIPKYKVFWNPAKRPGYSGTAMLYKDTLPVSNIVKGMGDSDEEGRIVTLELPDYIIVDGYIPNGMGSADRMKFKLEFLDHFFGYTKELISSGKKIIIGGDFNVCHTEMDIWSPQVYKNRSPFLPVERDWLTDMFNLGLLDTFRKHNLEVPRRTWWHPRDTDRPDSRGLGIDYFITSDSLRDSVTRAEILKDVYGSDHCPILLEIES